MEGPILDVLDYRKGQLPIFTHHSPGNCTLLSLLSGLLIRRGVATASRRLLAISGNQVLGPDCMGTLQSEKSLEYEHATLSQGTPLALREARPAVETKMEFAHNPRPCRASQLMPAPHTTALTSLKVTETRNSRWCPRR